MRLFAATARHASKRLPRCRLFSQQDKPTEYDRFFLLTNALHRQNDKDLFDDHLEKRKQARQHLEDATKLISQAKQDLQAIDVPPVFKMSMYIQLRDIQQAIEEILSPTPDEHRPHPPRL